MCPSDSNGNYSLPLGYLAVTGDTIQASQHNPPLEDIASSLTARLMRSGAAPMTGPLKFTEGSAAAPSISFSGSPTWGFYKTTAGVGVSVSGTQVAEFGPAGVTLGLPVATVTVPGISELASSAETVAGLVTHHISVSAGAGTFTDGETVTATGGGSGIYVLSASTGSVFAVRGGTGVFTGTLTGGTSAATRTISTYAPVVTTPVGLAAALAAFIPSYPRGYKNGGTLSNNVTDATNDIDVEAGAFRNATNTGNINLSAMTKKLDANWVAGTNQGMRNSAAGIADGTYHIYGVAKADGVGDVYAHTSATAATALAALQAESGGADYVYIRRIGSIMRESGVIAPFKQKGGVFLRNAPVRDGGPLSVNTTEQTLTLASVPNGIEVEAIVNGWLSAGDGLSFSLHSLTQSFSVTAADGPASAGGSITGSGVATTGSAIPTQRVLTNTSRQIRYRASGSGTAAYVWTLGWLDFFE